MGTFDTWASPDEVELNLVRDRMVMRRLSQLCEYDKNPKEHDIEMIKRSIVEFGYTSPMIVNSENGILLSGHGRLMALRELYADRPDLPPAGVALVGSGEVEAGEDGTYRHEWAVMVVQVSIPPEKHSEYVIMDNKTVESGGWNETVLADLLKKSISVDRVQYTGFDNKEILSIIGKRANSDSELDKVHRQWDDDKEETYGEIINIVGVLEHGARISFNGGNHVLYYGDARKIVGDDFRVSVLCTDPPYCHNKVHGIRSARESSIKNDDLDVAGYIELLRGVIPLSIKMAYVFTHWASWIPTASVMESLGFDTQTMAIWDKKSPTLGNNNWRCQHELIYVGYRDVDKKALPIAQYGNMFRMATVPYKGHPTAKPIQLISNVLSREVMQNMVVFDPFAGSGTTMLACESSGLRSVSIELDEKFIYGLIKRALDWGLKIDD